MDLDEAKNESLRRSNETGEIEKFIYGRKDRKDIISSVDNNKLENKID